MTPPSQLVAQRLHLAARRAQLGEVRAYWRTVRVRLREVIAEARNVRHGPLLERALARRRAAQRP